MKIQKILTITTVILLVIIISLASIFGIYKKEDYRISNKVPEYKLGMEFTNARIVDLKASEESEDENVNKQNYMLSKKVLEERLNKLEVGQYIIRQTENGNIQIEMANDDEEKTDTVISLLGEKGVFQLTDNETSEVLLDNSYVVDANVVYSQTDQNENTVFLQIKFNKEGKQKLEEISKIYVSTVEQTENEDGETEDTTVTKEVAIVFDGETYRTTYFGDTLTTGTLNVAIGQASDTESLKQYAETAEQMAVLLNSGVLPTEYDVTQYTISSSLANTSFEIIIYSIIVALIIVMLVYLVITLKLKGLLAIVLQIGYAGLLLLALRYTNIKLTLEGIVGIAISVILNFVYIYSAFKNLNSDFIKDTTAKIGLKSIPICIIAIVFTFNSITNISSLGMTLVWGLISIYLYNLILTQIIVKTIKSK